MIKSLYPCFRHWSEKGSVYLISDTHFDDKDCKYMDTHWPTPEEYINKFHFITKNDTLIHLGDVGNPEYLTKFKCYKVLIMGNHDQSKTKFEPYFDEIYSGILTIGEKLVLSHEPIDISFMFNIHGHDHNPQHRGDYNHCNLASNVIGYRALDLKKVIKNGMISKIETLHRITIDKRSNYYDKF